jgi:hypothetical protein
MLPFLPALILLFLQGPAGIERMAVNGHLPGALEALHRQMPDNARPADEVVFASLLAATTDKEMSRALLQLFTLMEPAPAPVSKPVVVQESSPPVPIPPTLGAPIDGFFACRRSRDGPVAA